MQITAFDLAQRFIGTKEVAGTASNPLILAMLKLDGDWPTDDAVPWCFTGDIEILTADGFTRFDSIKDDVIVAQVDEKLGLSFVAPLKVIRRHHEGKLAHIAGRDFNITCDPEHRFLGVWNRANAYAAPCELRPISSLTSQLFVPSVCSTIQTDNADWTDHDLSLLAAFLSDGSFHRNKLSFQVSRPRKLDALRALDPQLEYRATTAYGISKTPLTTFEFDQPSVFATAFDSYKTPKWSVLLSLSVRQIRHFLSTYVVFDGHQRGDSHSLYTSRTALRDWLQGAVTLAGWHSSYRQSSVSTYSGLPCFEIVYSPNKRTRTIRSDQVSYASGSCDLYCVQVSTGAIVIRDSKGTVIPVGNCSAFTNFITWLLRLPRSKSLAAKSWLDVGTPIAIEQAVAGSDIVVLSRDGGGHVGFFAAYDKANKEIYILGGNQGDAVCIRSFPAAAVLGVRRLA